MTLTISLYVFTSTHLFLLFNNSNDSFVAPLVKMLSLNPKNRISINDAIKVIESFEAIGEELRKEIIGKIENYKTIIFDFVVVIQKS